MGVSAEQMTDHAKLLQRVLEKLAPDEKDRAALTEVLGRYGLSRWQPEGDRVRLAILKLAGSGSIERVRYFTLQACRDYRDVLTAAEYPNQSSRHFLREKDPEEYARLCAKDREQYRDWYLGILWGKPA